MDEIERLIPSFRAVMATETIRHRAVNGLNTLEYFERDINAHRDRYNTKLNAILFVNPDLTTEVEVARTQINTIAQQEITRARLNGTVEFPDIVDHARTVLLSHMEKRHGT